MPALVHQDFYLGTRTDIFAAGGGFVGRLVRNSHAYHSPVSAPEIFGVVAASHWITDEIRFRVTQSQIAPLPFAETVAPWTSGAPRLVAQPPPINWPQLYTHYAQVVLADGGTYFLPLASQDPVI